MHSYKFRPGTIIEDDKFTEVTSPKDLVDYVQTNQLHGQFFVDEFDNICIFDKHLGKQ